MKDLVGETDYSLGTTTPKPRKVISEQEYIKQWMVKTDEQTQQRNYEHKVELKKELKSKELALSKVKATITHSKIMSDVKTDEVDYAKEKAAKAKEKATKARFARERAFEKKMKNLESLDKKLTQRKEKLEKECDINFMMKLTKSEVLNAEKTLTPMQLKKTDLLGTYFDGNLDGKITNGHFSSSRFFTPLELMNSKETSQFPLSCRCKLAQVRGEEIISNVEYSDSTEDSSKDFYKSIDAKKYKHIAFLDKALKSIAVQFGLIAFFLNFFSKNLFGQNKLGDPTTYVCSTSTSNAVFVAWGEMLIFVLVEVFVIYGDKDSESKILKQNQHLVLVILYGLWTWLYRNERMLFRRFASSRESKLRMLSIKKLLCCCNRKCYRSIANSILCLVGSPTLPKDFRDLHRDPVDSDEEAPNAPVLAVLDRLEQDGEDGTTSNAAFERWSEDWVSRPKGKSIQSKKYTGNAGTFVSSVDNGKSDSIYHKYDGKGIDSMLSLLHDLKKEREEREKSPKSIAEMMNGINQKVEEETRKAVAKRNRELEQLLKETEKHGFSTKKPALEEPDSANGDSTNSSDVRRDSTGGTLSPRKSENISPLAPTTETIVTLPSTTGRKFSSEGIRSRKTSNASCKDSSGDENYSSEAYDDFPERQFGRRNSRSGFDSDSSSTNSSVSDEDVSLLSRKEQRKLKKRKTLSPNYKSRKLRGRNRERFDEFLEKVMVHHRQLPDKMQLCQDKLNPKLAYIAMFIAFISAIPKILYVYSSVLPDICAISKLGNRPLEHDIFEFFKAMFIIRLPEFFKYILFSIVSLFVPALFFLLKIATPEAVEARGTLYFLKFVGYIWVLAEICYQFDVFGSDFSWSNVHEAGERNDFSWESNNNNGEGSSASSINDQKKLKKAHHLLSKSSSSSTVILDGYIAEKSDIILHFMILVAFLDVFSLVKRGAEIFLEYTNLHNYIFNSALAQFCSDMVRNNSYFKQKNYLIYRSSRVAPMGNSVNRDGNSSDDSYSDSYSDVELSDSDYDSEYMNNASETSNLLSSEAHSRWSTPDDEVTPRVSPTMGVRSLGSGGYDSGRKLPV